MKRVGGAAVGAMFVALAILGAQGLLAADHRDEGGRSLRAFLTGFEEPPTVFSTGRGKFEAKISRDESSFDYTLSYEGIEGTVTQSHIHVGQVKVNGGIAIWLCQTSTNLAPLSVRDLTPTCPGAHEGTVTGTVTAANVIGPAAQGVAIGEFEEVLRALRLGVAYANVHSDRSPGGEIRGQIRRHDDDN